MTAKIDEVSYIIKKLMYNTDWAYCYGYITAYIEDSIKTISKEDVKKLHGFLFDKIIFQTIRIPTNKIGD